MYCSNCGCGLRPGNRFCTQCGCGIGYPCHACGTLVVPGDRFCGACGAGLVPGAVRPRPGEGGAGYTVPPFWPVVQPQAAVQPPPQPTHAPPPPPSDAPPPAETPVAEPEADERAADLRGRVSSQYLDRAREEGAQAMEGDRRRVTILYADVSGYTAMSEALDHEEVTHVMNGLFDIFVSIVETYQGWIVKTVGDAVVVSFGAPIALEDASERAIRAGLDIQAAIATYEPKGVDLGGIRLQVRIGIHEGEVTAGRIISDGTRTYDLMGTTVNIAARLESAAPVGGILVSQVVRDRVGESFEFETLEPLHLKNVSEPVQAYTVQGLRRREARLDRSRRFGLSRMIGRGRAQRKLRELLDLAAKGEGQVVSITGEAGVGKSRLVLEMREPALEAGFRVLEGQCVSFGRHVAYLPLRDIIRGAAGVDDLAPEPEQREGLRGFVEALGEGMPGLATPLGAVLDLKFPDSDFQALSPEGRRQAIQRRLVEFVLAMASQRPLMLVIDDLQWLDSSSQEILEDLIPRIADQPILLVLMHRLDYSHFWEPAANVAEIELNRLSDDEALELLADRVGQRAIPPKVREQVIARAHGNPFFLEEIVRALVATGALENGEVTLDAVPETISDLLMARIDALPEPARKVLQVAAVMQSPVRVRLVEELVGEDGIDASAALAELARMRFLRRRDPGATPADRRDARRGESDAEYDFEHHLAQDVAYASIFRRRRAELHARTAQVIERVFRARIRSVVHLLAHHYEQAGLRELAIPCLAHEVRVSRIVGNYPQLFETCERAIRLVATLSEDPAYRAILARLHVDRCEGLARSGDASLAIEDAHRGLEAAVPVGALEVEADAHKLLGYSHGRLGDYARASEHYRLARRTFELLGDTSGVMECTHGAAYILHEKGDYEQAAGLYREILRDLRAGSARGRAARTGDEFAALISLGSCLERLDQFDEALENYSEAEQQAERLAVELADAPHRIDRLGMAFCKANVGLAQFALGWHRKALGIFTQACDQFRALQVRHMEAALLSDIARSHLELGHYDYALAEARNSREKALEVHADPFVLNALLAESLALSETGSGAEAVQLANQAMQLARPLGNPGALADTYMALGQGLLRSGDAEGALAAYGSALRLGREAKSRRTEAYACVGLGSTQARLPDLPLARETLGRALELAQALRTRLPMARARLGLGRVEAASGRTDEAVEHLRAAVDVASEIENPAVLWRAYAELARIRRTRGDQQAALIHYVKAIEALRPLTANRAGPAGAGSPRDGLIELQAEAAALMLEMGRAPSLPAEPAGEVISLLTSHAPTEALREHSPEVATLFEQLLSQADLDPETFARN